MGKRNRFELPEIPKELAAYSKEIKATIKDTVSLKLRPATSLKIWESKVGGEPYLPLTEAYPCNSEGEKLRFLAQINFSEMPALPSYPEKGILEFYINAYDDLLGMGYEDPAEEHEGFKILYFDNVYEDESKLRKDTKMYQDQEEMDSVSFPLREDCDYSVEFYRGKQYITTTDYRFQRMAFAKDFDLVDDIYGNVLSEGGHRIGGYPHFTQEDPRGEHGVLRGYELLFQLDSDQEEGVDIAWGDLGVGAFFIHPDDLRSRNFNKVLYNWDCS